MVDVYRLWGGAYFLVNLDGYLDRLRENLEVTDEQITNAREMSRNKALDSRSRLQSIKILRDLVEQRNMIMSNIKAHLLGRDATGAVKEPASFYEGNSMVEFERNFKRFLTPWTTEDLKIKCEDCDVESENVSTRSIQKEVPMNLTKDLTTTETEHHDVCSKCYEERLANGQPQVKLENTAAEAESE